LLFAVSVDPVYDSSCVGVIAMAEICASGHLAVDDRALFEGDIGLFIKIWTHLIVLVLSIHEVLEALIG
jgi:hypothetical protein